MKINDDNFEFVFAPPPPGQPEHGPNLPPEGPPQPSCVGGEPQHGQPKDAKPKPWDLNNPDVFQEALDAVLKDIEDQEHASERTRLQADFELGRPSSSNITENDIKKAIAKGKLKDTPQRKAAIEKEINDPDISEERRKMLKKYFG
jgi:hypothetical protein